MFAFSGTNRGVLRAILVAGLVFVSGTGCFTNTLEFGGGGPGESITSDNPLAGGSYGSSLITLSRVVRSSSDPNKYLDLVGDGSGSIGMFCGASESESNTNDPTTPSSCTCSYTYTGSSGTPQTADEQTVYREADLLRCKRPTILDPTVSSVKVSIHTAADTFSNEITFNLTTNGLTLDTSSPLSFVQAIRYQCREALFVPYLLDGSLYDPFLSEDARLAYPMTFYTTNMGGAMTSFVTSGTKPAGGAGWICPSVPVDTSLGTDSADTNYDLRIFSVAADSQGSKSIFPRTGTDRHDFFVAKEPSGAFNIAVNALVAPGVLTDEDPGTAAPPPLGYGAAPIPVSGGTDRETCPAGVTIPPGYQWAKLWLFRGSLEPRRLSKSTKIQSLGSVGCNPGMWSGTNEPVVPDCNVGGDGGATNLSGKADRVLGLEGAGVCVRPDFSAFHWSANPALILHSIPDDADKWTPRAGKYSSLNDELDPLRVRDWFLPYDPTPDSTDLARDSGVSRWDAMYVVTPVTISTDDMRHAMDRDAAKPYVPYRFYARTFCQSADPDNPTPGDCSADKKIRYDLELRDITKLESPDDPNYSRAFPVCVLQKTSL